MSPHSCSGLSTDFSQIHSQLFSLRSFGTRSSPHTARSQPESRLLASPSIARVHTSLLPPHHLRIMQALQAMARLEAHHRSRSSPNRQLLARAILIVCLVLLAIRTSIRMTLQ